MKFPLLTAALVAVAAPAVAQNTPEECALQAEIVMAVVAAREDGAAAAEAQGAVAGQLSGAAEKYLPVVPAIAEWVYSLPEEELGAEIGESWAAQCENM